MTAKASPSLSVVVPTCGRPDHAVECVRSILRNTDLIELVVVDQSDDDETERRLAVFADARLSHRRAETRGVTNARNFGIAASRGSVIAFTDDDCRAPADWTTQILGVFAGDPDASLVCGRVQVPPELWSRGFTESFEPHERVWIGRYPPFGRDWGITANMSVRREALEQVGAFDPFLGAGAPLRSGGEPDLIFRMLKAGLKVVNASEVVVDHLGVRPHGEAASRLMRGYGFGTGAALFKHVRLGDVSALKLYLKFVAHNVARTATNLLRKGRPTGFGYLAGFVAGSAASYRYAVDRRRRVYVERQR